MIFEFELVGAVMHICIGTHELLLSLSFDMRIGFSIWTPNSGRYDEYCVSANKSRQTEYSLFSSKSRSKIAHFVVFVIVICVCVCGMVFFPF